MRKRNVIYIDTYNNFIFTPLAASKCSDDRLKPFNGTCYLFVSYPEVDWFTAQQVCAGIHGKFTDFLFRYLNNIMLLSLKIY